MDAFYGGLAVGFGVLLFSSKARREATTLGSDLFDGSGAGASGRAGAGGGAGSAGPSGGAGEAIGRVDPCCCGGGGKNAFRPDAAVTVGRLSGPSSPALVAIQGPTRATFIPALYHL